MNWRAIPLALKCALSCSSSRSRRGLTYGLADTYMAAEPSHSASAGLAS